MYAALSVVCEKGQGSSVKLCAAEEGGKTPLHHNTRGADKSLARPGRKQLMFLSE